MESRLADLRRLLSQLTPHDAEEAAHLARMQSLCASQADPCARDHFAPGHFTASAFVLSPEGGELLLIHHSKLGRWLQPGGHVDAGDETLLHAARRELQEEVGLRHVELLRPAPFDLDVHDIPPLKEAPGHAHFDVRFLFRAPTREVQAGSDAKAARWVALSHVDLEISDRSVMRAVEKLVQGKHRA